MDELIKEVVNIVLTAKDDWLMEFDLKKAINLYVEEQKYKAYEDGCEVGYVEGYNTGYNEGYEEGGGGCYD